METITLTTLEEIRIFSDPYRMDIIDEFQRLNRPATVKEIADIMGEVPAKVYYHAKKLMSIGLLTLDHTQQINGITAKYYQAFQGTIAVKRSETDTPTHNVLSETQKLLGDIYEKNKQRFLSMVSIDNNSKAHISNQTVYLTKEEIEQFLEMINQFYEAHKQPQPHNEQDKYEFFTSIVKEKSTNQDKLS